MKRNVALSMFALVIVATTVALADQPRPQTTDLVRPTVTPPGGPGTPSDPMELANSHPCPWTEPGGHWGNNHASCVFTCANLDVVTLSVSSGDTVEVTGNGGCGHATASCHGQSSCSGASRRTAGSAAEGQCSAGSDEWWASALTVDCQATPSESCPNLIGCATGDGSDEEPSDA